MFRNYVLVAFRNMKKYKTTSIINIIGLSIGIAGSMLLAFWVYNELNYDKQFQDHERIHRIWLEIKTKTSTRQFSGICSPVAPLLKEKYPQVEETARIIPAGPYVVYHEQKSSMKEASSMLIRKCSLCLIIIFFEVTRKTRSKDRIQLYLRKLLHENISVMETRYRKKSKEDQENLR